jgi:hypothetical protein
METLGPQSAKAHCLWHQNNIRSLEPQKLKDFFFQDGELC